MTHKGDRSTLQNLLFLQVRAAEAENSDMNAILTELRSYCEEFKTRLTYFSD